MTKKLDRKAIGNLMLLEGVHGSLGQKSSFGEGGQGLRFTKRTYNIYTRDLAFHFLSRRTETRNFFDNLSFCITSLASSTQKGKKTAVPEL